MFIILIIFHMQVAVQKQMGLRAFEQQYAHEYFSYVLNEVKVKFMHLFFLANLLGCPNQT